MLCYRGLSFTSCLNNTYKITSMLKRAYPWWDIKYRYCATKTLKLVFIIHFSHSFHYGIVQWSLQSWWCFQFTKRSYIMELYLFPILFCIFQVPLVTVSSVASVNVAIRGGTTSLNKTTQILINPPQNLIFIQSDKPIYKPGQTSNISLSKLFHSSFSCLYAYSYLLIWTCESFCIAC